jgi:hypothetical protein
MSHATKTRNESSDAPVRVLGRGLRAKRGVHLTMRTVREAVGQTQDDVAHATGMDQSDVSRLENRGDFGDCQIWTLQRYVTALGGQLELVAVFGDKKIILAGTTTGPAHKRVEPTRWRAAHSRTCVSSWPFRRLARFTTTP